MNEREVSLLPPPRELVWRGCVDASAFWLPVGSGLLTEVEACRRVLSLWRPGVTVYALEGGLLVVQPAPGRGIRTEEAPGTPLVRFAKGLLCAAPVIPSEARRLQELAASGQSGSDAVALVRGGNWEIVTLNASQMVDPAMWLDLGNAVVVSDALSLGAPPAPVVDVLQPVNFNPRTAYGKVATADPPSELAELVATLRGQAGAGKAGETRTNIGMALDGAFRRLAASLRSRMQPPTFGRDGGASSNAGGGVSHRPGEQSLALARGEAFEAWLHWRIARLAGLIGLGGLIGGKQAQYVRKMLDLFERGDLEQALRHAIPLGGEIDSALKRLPPSLFTPKPRTDLALRPGQTAAASSLGFSPDLHSHLNALYRQAFTRLEREGRIDEAAFVLAELLNSTEEAVNFLEKHRRLELAADMAEARGLHPGWVVRLRFLAGDTGRAVAFARRTGAWVEAISQLERRPEHKQEACALRLEWAASLARAGEYSQAISAALPVAEARDLVREWMNRVIKGGGVPAARMYARRLALFPDTDDLWQTEAMTLLAGEDEVSAVERLAFISEITRPDTWTSPETVLLQRMLARVAVRTLARDTFRGVLEPKLYDALLQTAADPVLKADAPKMREVLSAVPAALQHRVLRERSPAEPPLVVAENDTGLVPVHDAAYLPSRRTLVALGEMGVRLLSPDGRTLREWTTVPAHRLVPADSGNVAVALARRGSLWRLTRLDLVTGAVTPWCDAEIPVFAPDSDGSLWMVALPKGGGTEALAAIDLQGAPDRLASLWRTSLEEGRFVAIARSSSACMALTMHKRSERASFTMPSPLELTSEWQEWRFEMPSLTMRNRSHWEMVAKKGATAALDPWWQGAVDPSATGTIVIRKVEPSGAASIPSHTRLELRRQGTSFSLREYVEHHRVSPATPVVGGGWLVDIQYPGEGEPPRLVLLSLTDAKPDSDLRALTRLCVVMEGAKTIGARIFTGSLTVWDDRGRVLAFDLYNDCIHANLRVH